MNTKFPNNTHLLQLNIYRRCIKNNLIQTVKCQKQEQQRYDQIYCQCQELLMQLEQQKQCIQMEYAQVLEQLDLYKKQQKQLEMRHRKSIEEYQENAVFHKQLIGLGNQLRQTRQLILNGKKWKKDERTKEILNIKIKQITNKIQITKRKIEEDEKINLRKLKQARMIKQQYQNMEQEYNANHNRIYILQQRVQQRRQLNKQLQIEKKEKEQILKQRKQRNCNKQQMIREITANIEKQEQLKAKIRVMQRNVESEQVEINKEKENLIKQVLIKQNNLQNYTHMKQHLSAVKQINARLLKIITTSRMQQQSKYWNQAGKENEPILLKDRTNNKYNIDMYY